MHKKHTEEKEEKEEKVEPTQPKEEKVEPPVKTVSREERLEECLTYLRDNVVHGNANHVEKINKALSGGEHANI